MNYHHEQLYYPHDINKDNQTKLINHFDALVERYSKLLPLRLDLHYQLGSEKTVSGAYSDMFLLLKLIKSSHTSVVGVAFALEYSITERLHIHAVFYINGQKHRSFYVIQSEILNLWHERISSSNNVHSCNQSQKYKYDGLKNFNHQDTETQGHFKKALNYMSKNEQKEQIPEAYQIGVSIVPPKSKSGRPRKRTDEDDFLGLF